MKMRLLLFLLVTFTGFTALAQPTSQAPDKTENSLLWKITGKELTEPSYLFGTIHMINKKDFFFTPVMERSFSDSRRVVFEIDMEDMTDMAAMMPVMMKAFMADGATLSDLLSDEDYEIVSAHFEKMGLPMVFMERIKPMFLSALTSEDALSFTKDTSSIMSYEMELTRMAKMEEKPIDGLETAEFQMSMFDSIPYDVQARMLVDGIKNNDEPDSQLDQLVELYKAQDLYGLQALMAEDPEGLGKYNELLLERRNRNWIPIMEKMMTEGPTFFAVGAGHLGGEAGVIALLREEGYTLTPVREEN